MATDLLIELPKVCTKCGQSKPRSEFNKHHIGWDGVRPDCRDCQRARARAYVAANRAKHNESGKRWYEQNKSRRYETAQAWKAANIEKHRKHQRDAKRRLLATPKGKLEANVRDQIRAGIMKGSKRGRRTFALLGYTVEELKRHLERLFQPGMSWENYGPVWEIDHIIPRAAFNYSTPDHLDFKRAWALTNLRPLWRSDNRRKHAKLDRPFQPSLMMGG